VCVCVCNTIIAKGENVELIRSFTRAHAERVVGISTNAPPKPGGVRRAHAFVSVSFVSARQTRVRAIRRNARPFLPVERFATFRTENDTFYVRAATAGAQYQSKSRARVTRSRRVNIARRRRQSKYRWTLTAIGFRTGKR
jgi:hypothetical protein